MGQAEGVYNARLQNIALTLDKVKIFLRNMDFHLPSIIYIIYAFLKGVHLGLSFFSSFFSVMVALIALA